MKEIKRQVDMLKRNDFNGYYSDLITFVNDKYEQYEKRNAKKVEVKVDDETVATAVVEDK